MVSAGALLLEESEDLLRQYEQTGDERAFAEIVQRYRGMVFGVCLRVMRNSHDAEDATQAVFLTLSMQARGGNNIRTLGPWLQQVAQRVSLDMYKSRKRRQAREDVKRSQTSDRFDATESRQLDRDELRETLRKQLNELPAKYRLPMILYYFGGLTPEAIAKELGCKKKTLGVRLFRARKLLAEQLASRGVVACGAPLLLALREVVQQGLYHSLPASGAHYASGVGTGLGLGFDHLSTSLAAMSRAMSRFAFGSKLRLVLTLLIALSSAMAGSAALIRSFDLRELKAIKLFSPNLDLHNLLRSLPRVPVPQVREAISELPSQESREVPGVVVPLVQPAAAAVHSRLMMSAARPLPTPPAIAYASVPAAHTAAKTVKSQPIPLPQPFVRTGIATSVPFQVAGGNHTEVSKTSVAAIAQPESSPDKSPVEKTASVELASDEWNRPPAQNGSVFESVSAVASLTVTSQDSLSLNAGDYSGSLPLWDSAGIHDLSAGLKTDGAFVSNSTAAPTLVAVIPEPATLSLCMIGLSLLLARRHRL